MKIIIFHFYMNKLTKLDRNLTLFGFMYIFGKWKNKVTLFSTKIYIFDKCQMNTTYFFEWASAILSKWIVNWTVLTIWSNFNWIFTMINDIGLAVAYPTICMKGNIAQTNWSYDTCVLDGQGHSYILLRNSTQPTLQPIEVLSTIRLNLRWSNYDEYINRPRKIRKDCGTQIGVKMRGV